MRIPVELATVKERNGSLYFQLYAGALQAIASLEPGTWLMVQPHPHRDPESVWDDYGVLLIEKEPDKARRIRTG